MKRKRPPIAFMTASAAIAFDCAALRKISEAGMEVVVVEDKNFEESLRLLERVRSETKPEDD